MIAKDGGGTQKNESEEGYLIGTVISITCDDSWIFLDKTLKRDIICTLNESIGSWRPFGNSSWDHFLCIGENLFLINFL